MRMQNNLIRRLKPKVLIFAVTALTMPFALQAQDAKITLPSGGATANQLFDLIHAQTPYRVTVDNARINDGMKVTAKRAPISVSEALTQLLAGTGYTYTMDGNYIFLPLTSNEASAMGDTTPPQVTHTAKHTVPETVVSASDNKPVENITPKQPAAQTTSAVKTTVYFVPNVQDNTIKAFTDEPKTSLSLVPESNIRKTNYLPKAAIKTNLLYLATTSLNFGFEVGMARRWTFELTGGINTWDLNGKKGGIRHWLVQPEFRYWFCNRFERHFIGLHGIGGKFEVGNIDLTPMVKDLTDIRYNGYGIGGGISYGYHLPMGKRWGWEFTVGAGYIYLEYDKYTCGTCDKLLYNKVKHYFGPTKAGISLLFMIR